MEAKTPRYVGFILAIRALSTGLQIADVFIGRHMSSVSGFWAISHVLLSGPRLRNCNKSG